ncbi:Glucosaminyl phosphatidylinositol (GlcN-PI) nositol acylation protein [Elasticomyces elasticus]|nr:Glucosaminyl phosphatidylinositol (GlcN-PI) nositol acylation protein [Elasticomyces elasticus]
MRLRQTTTAFGCSRNEQVPKPNCSPTLLHKVSTLSSSAGEDIATASKDQSIYQRPALQISQRSSSGSNQYFTGCLRKNREGLFSFVGYFSIFIAGMGAGWTILRRESHSGELEDETRDPLDEDEEWLADVLGSSDPSDITAGD